MTVYALGHKNPDSDTVCAALSLAYLQNQLGIETTAVTQGAITPETSFILDRYGVAVPEIKTSFAGEKVFLVDTSDLSQLPDDISDAQIMGIVDHHKLGNVTTSNPLECWIWPVGCSCTVLKAMYDFNKIDVPKDIAGIMLCAILSDTVIFKSATCTDKDKEVAADLAKITNEDDLQALGMSMFEVKSAIKGTPIRDLVERDYKDFDMNGCKVGIGQLEVVDLTLLDDVKESLARDIIALKQEGNRHSVFLMLTDIIQESTELLIASDDPSIIEKAFGVAPEANKVWLKGVMSRKKQVVPNFEKAFA
jgi:manganese-dependent inorganic pyrophosphatase